ncbi:MAG: response regulator transcription factor [Acidobacteriota bacterium]
MTPLRVLIVEDHPGIAQNIADYLSEEEFELDFASDGLGGLHLALTRSYDVLVLDIMLPGLDGLELCRKLRQEASGPASGIPILMLTARDTVADKLAGFRVGTDDYLTKPFALEELEARIHALGQRQRRSQRQPLQVGPLRLDVGRRLASRDDQALDVTPTGFRILLALIKGYPEVVTREEMEHLIWGTEPPLSDALRTHVAALRRVVDKPFDSPMIETLYGVGWRLRLPATTAPESEP